MFISEIICNFAFKYIINIENNICMKQILWFVKTYITLVILFVLQKPLFLILEKGAATQPVDNILIDMPAVIWHGLPLDLSMAGYLSVIPGILTIAAIWFKKELIRPIMNTYFVIASLIITCSFWLMQVFIHIGNIRWTARRYSISSPRQLTP